MNFYVEMPNWLYTLEYDYEESKTCEESSCREEGICRCGTIENTTITEVGITQSEITIKIDGKNKRKIIYKRSKIDKYCIDRLLHIHNVYDKESYELGICNGYYGEEICSATFCNEKNLLKDIEEMLQMTDIEKIKFVLHKEYNYLLPEVEQTKYVKIEYRDIDLLVANNTYLSRVKKEDIFLTSDTSLPQGIVVGNRLIDGYHRVSKNIMLGNNTCKFIILKENNNGI